MLPHLETAEDRKRKALGYWTRFRTMVHVPGFPLRKNWRFHREVLGADIASGVVLGLMVIPRTYRVPQH